MQSHHEDVLSVHEIVAKNDVEQLYSIFRTSGRSVSNKKNEKDQTPLHVAVIKNKGSSHFRVIHILLENGADVYALDKYRKSPLWYLVRNCSVRIFALFLRFNMDAEHFSELLTPTIRYAGRYKLDVVKFLVQEVGLDINNRNGYGMTPLHEAACCNQINSHYEVIECLLQLGADVNARDIYGCTPLWILIQNHYNLDILKLFLKFKVELRVLNDRKESLLTPATNNCNNLDVIKFFVRDVGLDINHRDEDEQTPLHEAARYNKGNSHYEVLEFLLEMGADVNAQNRYDKTALWYLVKNSASVEVLKLFLRFKADFTSTFCCTGANGDSPFIPAFDNLDVFKFLFEDAGFDVNCQDEFEMTPLHHAASCNETNSHYQVIEYLLKKGADVNVKDCNGYTPLFNLLESGNLKLDLRVFELFLKYIVDVHAVTDYVIEVVDEFNYEESNIQFLQKLISDFDLDLNCTNGPHETTPLHHIFKYTSSPINIKLVKCLLKNGANINIYDKNGFTPLISAMQMIHKKNRKDLLWKNFNCYSFIIDQIDFSYVHSNKHVLGYYNEDGVEVNHQTNPQLYLWKWILEHLAKLKFLSIPVHQVVLEFIEHHTDHKDYFTKCIKELEVMKNNKPQNSWINFLNLLVDDRRKLKNYAGSKDLIQDYEKSDWLKKFPTYGASLKKSVEKGMKRRELFDKSSILLSDCLPIFNSTHLVIKDIFDYILSKKVLSKFCE